MRRTGHQDQKQKLVVVEEKENHWNTGPSLFDSLWDLQVHGSKCELPGSKRK